MKLSPTEHAALELLISKGGSTIANTVPDKNEKRITAGTFYTVPGHGIYKKLEKKGLVFYTEEDPMDDGFVFTNEIYITDEGREAVKKGYVSDIDEVRADAWARCNEFHKAKIK